MKFFIQVVHPTLGKIESETYDANESQYEVIRAELADSTKGVPSMDFYTKTGDYVIMSQEIIRNSIIFLKIKK